MYYKTQSYTDTHTVTGPVIPVILPPVHTYTQSRKNCNILKFMNISWFPGGHDYVTCGHEKSAYRFSRQFSKKHINFLDAVSWILSRTSTCRFLVTMGHITLTLGPRKTSWNNVAILSRLRVEEYFCKTLSDWLKSFAALSSIYEITKLLHQDTALQFQLFDYTGSHPVNAE